MSLCRATKANGEPCKAPATEPDGWCWAHAPEHAEKRSRMASRAAKSKPSRELVGIKRQLQKLTDDALAGKVERGVAAVCGQLLNVKLRAVEVERKLREQEEFEERLAALERASEGQGREGRSWGA